MSTPTKRIAFHTLGCKLNFSETATISRDFLRHGFEKVNYKDTADIYVLNTCTVTENADKEARTPFLDKAFVKYYLSIPPELKTFDGTRRLEIGRASCRERV